MVGLARAGTQRLYVNSYAYVFRYKSKVNSSRRYDCVKYRSVCPCPARVSIDVYGKCTDYGNRVHNHPDPLQEFRSCVVKERIRNDLRGTALLDRPDVRSIFERRAVE